VCPLTDDPAGALELPLACVASELHGVEKVREIAVVGRDVFVGGNTAHIVRLTVVDSVRDVPCATGQSRIPSLCDYAEGVSVLHSLLTTLRRACAVLSCPLLSSPVLSSPVLSSPVLSHPVLFVARLGCRVDATCVHRHPLWP
jgi:hypothetical protein